MKIPSTVSELSAKLSMAESQNSQDKRVEELWHKLDPESRGELDLKGLQKGLRRIDHPMKNADDLLKEIIKSVDASGDGKIQYEEFRVFVETAERKLRLLFRSIDRDNNGRLDKEELSSAFRKCGLTVSQRRLDGFFDEIDKNNDGYITFEEWRDFLLFMPAHVHDGDGGGSALEKALSFYSSIVTLNAEGDSLVSEDTLEGLGTTGFLLHALFGSILKIAQPSPSSSADPISSSGRRQQSLEEPFDSSRPPDKGAQASQPPIPRLATEGDMLPSRSQLPRPPSQLPSAATIADHMSTVLPPPGVGLGSGFVPGRSENGIPRGRGIRAGAPRNELGGGGGDFEDGFSDSVELSHQREPLTLASRLTEYLPEPGYFLAGAIAGGVSRTATAPLDRLKVYLLVNTKPSVSVALDAATHGHPLVAVKNAAMPITTAVANLFKAGGIRTFFAGNGLNVVKIMPETAIKFGSYEFAKRTLATLEGHQDPARINPLSKFVAGGVAGMIAQFCVYPLDTLKFRLQCETVQGGLTGNALLIQTAKKMYATGGVRAAYRGVTMGLVGMFPYSAIDMGTFEFLKNAFRHHKARLYGIHEDDAGPGNVATGMIGATSGAFGATIVYPLNVLRTRLQTQGTVMHPPTYTGIWDVTAKTIRNEGIRGLYKGLSPNLLKVAPALSITWIVYENSKKFLNLH